ncbi:hypothetical protein JR316_0013113 [Psilocybe cubensis]|uniref:Uncharacterized protein n=1 Tax=Psilocybe cubensis TaxID=181762 RepID=A0ACB8GHV8_PSICU|nr:hypothetical protein JR316_0013113 [Psilocybe cubensis]KAH9474649.1 hypothetical protein JR316_0013113 [Psilocybe cubensis]
MSSVVIALDASPKIDVTAFELKQCKSRGKVVEISAALRRRLSLLSRYAYITFLALIPCMEVSDRIDLKDYGHEKYRTILEDQLSETQFLFKVAEQRAYELHHASMNATGRQDDETSDTESENCDHLDDDPDPRKSSPISSLSQNSTLQDEMDPIKAILAEKCNNIREQIWIQLARSCAPVQSRFYVERLEVIWACVRRAVCSDPKLMLLSRKYKSAINMLKDTTLELLTVTKIWTAINNLCAEDVRAAIDDVLHPVRTTGEYVVVFKARVHKDLSHASLPFHGWGHMAAFFPCYSNIRRTCESVDDIVELTRYALLCNVPIARESNLFKYPHEGIMNLLLCGFIPDSYARLEPNPSRGEGNTIGLKDMELLNYDWKPFVSVEMSLTDPKVNDFVNACFRRSDLVVSFRKGSANKEFCSKPLYGQTANIVKDSFEVKSLPDPCQPTHNLAFQNATPSVTPPKRIFDCFQLTITPEKRGEIKDFLTEIVHLWHKIYGVDNLTGLIRTVASPYIINQEMEFSDDSNLIPSVEPATDVSFKALWGRLPTVKEIENCVNIGRV